MPTGAASTTTDTVELLPLPLWEGKFLLGSDLVQPVLGTFFRCGIDTSEGECCGILMRGMRVLWDTYERLRLLRDAGAMG